MFKLGADNLSESGSKLCRHHFDMYLKMFEINQKACCNLFSKHTKRVTAGLRIITLSLAQEIKKNLNVHVAPGMKYCDTCRKGYEMKLKEDADSSSSQSVQLSQQQEGSQEESLKDSQSSAQTEGSQATSTYSDQDADLCLEKIQQIYDCLNLPAIKFEDRRPQSKRVYLKKKLEEASEVICKKMRLAYNLDENIDAIPEEVLLKARRFDEMMDAIKTKLEQDCRYSLKLQILTLVPQLETKEIQDRVGITRATANSARKLKVEKGLFELPAAKLGSRRLPEDEKQQVINFFCDETSGNSKMLAGKNQCVSIGRNQHKQKQLLLLNLRELYAAYKKDYPDSKVGFSTFCVLRPKWCVLPGSSGTHSVCVCTYHQNVDLQIFAKNPKLSSETVLPKLVCDTESRECMMRQCLLCPATEDISEILENLLFSPPDGGNKKCLPLRY